MCISFSKKNCNRKQLTNIEHIEKILSKPINNNPPIKIDDIHISNSRTIHVVQEGYLLAGTKQRVASLFVKKILNETKNNSKSQPNKSKIKTLCYAGSSNGFGAVATSYAAHSLGLGAKIFLGNPSGTTDSRQINTILALGAELHLCPSYRNARNQEFKMTNNPEGTSKWETLPEYYIVPMGLNDEKGIMIDLLSKQIKKASKGTILDLKNNSSNRIWLVAGSGGILQALYKAFPKNQYYVYLTGAGSYKKEVLKFIKSQKKEGKEANIFIVNDWKINSSPNNLNRSKMKYPSIIDYDYLVYPYVNKYGRDGDFIWNVAADDFL